MRRILARAAPPILNPFSIFNPHQNRWMMNCLSPLPAPVGIVKSFRPPRVVLATDQSEALRDRLIAELSDLKSTDEAADWVQQEPSSEEHADRR